MTDTIFKDLAAPFPPKSIHWRKGGGSGYLAYLNARDVMQRLDDVMGPNAWSDSYTETSSGRVICSLSLHLFGAEWVTKSDGAGNTSFEGEKGAISDAFKRAAVKWGIGRYLYDLPVVSSEAAGRQILEGGFGYKMGEGDARAIAKLLDDANPESGEGVDAFGEAWIEMSQDEQKSFAPWISKFYPGGVSKTKEHMRSVMAAYRNRMNGESSGISA